MREYLLATIYPLDRKVEDEEKKIEDFIRKAKGKVLNKENREEELAYKIKGETRGFLSKIFFSLPQEKLLELKKELDEKVNCLRYLVVKFPYSKIVGGQTGDVKAKKVKKGTSQKTQREPEKSKEEISKEKLDKALGKILK